MVRVIVRVRDRVRIRVLTLTLPLTPTLSQATAGRRGARSPPPAMVEYVGCAFR